VKYSIVISMLAIALLWTAACTMQPVQQDNGDEPESVLFGDRPKRDDSRQESGLRVIHRNSVATFRGEEMSALLERLERDDPEEWVYVRSHVYPAPQPPVSPEGRVNYRWPPEDTNRLSDRQRAWRSYLLWPEHLRELLQAEDWDEAENRRRLARYGRMYRLVYRFQSSSDYRDARRESEHWRDFAESMLAYGDDGRRLLIANMVLALTNPEEQIVHQAQHILVQLGAPAIEPLCTALWTGHNQLVEAQDSRGETIYVVQTNANFPKYVIDVLFQIGPRSVSQAIYELENGPLEGTAWRFRRNFVELLGRFRDPRAVRALVAEVDRVDIYELDRNAWAQGRRMVDEAATDHARYVYGQYLIQALGDIGAPEGLRGIIALWERDPDHEMASLEAIFRITRRRVLTLDEARVVAEQLDVSLKDE
jgi:hypothetical protein